VFNEPELEDVLYDVIEKRFGVKKKVK